MEDTNSKPFVEDVWRSLKVRGWSAYVLKKKLKMLKGELKR